jgi:hypothetical protein
MRFVGNFSGKFFVVSIQSFMALIPAFGSMFVYIEVASEVTNNELHLC